MAGRRSTPGRYFQVANPGAGWGGTDIVNPLSVLGAFDPKAARPGLRLLITSTTGEEALYCVLDDSLEPVPGEIPAEVEEVVERIRGNCEPARATVLFMGGAGGSLRAGVTEDPVRLTRSVRQRLTRVTMGGAPAYVWPGGGITVMTDVEQMPDRSFGSVPTPAIVAPIEFTMSTDDYKALGGHMDQVVTLQEVIDAYGGTARRDPWLDRNPWPGKPESGG